MSTTEQTTTQPQIENHPAPMEATAPAPDLGSTLNPQPLVAPKPGEGGSSLNLLASEFALGRAHRAATQAILRA